MRELVSKLIDTEDGVQMCYVEISGSSNETKPTVGIADGSIFTESNTGKVYFFSEEDGDWVEQFSFQS